MTAATPQQQQAFIAANKSNALGAAAALTGSSNTQLLNNDAAVILAQWADESGWGLNNNPNDNNLGGIECWSGCPVCDQSTGFCQYSDQFDFTNGYVKFLQGSNYDAVISAMKGGDPTAIIGAIVASPYDPSHYSSGGFQGAYSTVAGIMSTPGIGEAGMPGSQNNAGVQGIGCQCGISNIGCCLDNLGVIIVNSLKFAGTNLFVIFVLLILFYFLVKDTPAGRSIRSGVKNTVKTSAKAAATAAAA